MWMHLIRLWCLLPSFPKHYSLDSLTGLFLKRPFDLKLRMWLSRPTLPVRRPPFTLERRTFHGRPIFGAEIGEAPSSDLLQSLQIIPIYWPDSADCDEPTARATLTALVDSEYYCFEAPFGVVVEKLVPPWLQKVQSWATGANLTAVGFTTQVISGAKWVNLANFDANFEFYRP